MNRALNFLDWVCRVVFIVAVVLAVVTALIVLAARVAENPFGGVACICGILAAAAAIRGSWLFVREVLGGDGSIRSR